MEILKSIDIDKVILTMTEKDRKLQEAQSQNTDTQQFMNDLYRARSKELKQAQRRTEGETKMKEQALAKMEELRSEIQLLQGQDMTSMNIWRDKVAQMKEIAQGYQAQNAMLQESLSLAQRRAEENQSYQQQEHVHDQGTRNLNFGGAPKK